MSEFIRSPLELFIQFGNGEVSVGLAEHKSLNSTTFWTVILAALSKAYPLGEIPKDTEKTIPRDKIYLSYNSEVRAVKAIAGLVGKTEEEMQQRWNKRKAEADIEWLVMEATDMGNFNG